MFSYDQVGAAGDVINAQNRAGVYRGKSGYLYTGFDGCCGIGVGKVDRTGIAHISHGRSDGKIVISYQLPVTS